MSLTIKHKHFNPYISIFHIHELSITSLCLRAQCGGGAPKGKENTGVVNYFITTEARDMHVVLSIIYERRVDIEEKLLPNMNSNKPVTQYT